MNIKKSFKVDMILCFWIRYWFVFLSKGEWMFFYFCKICFERLYFLSNPSLAKHTGDDMIMITLIPYSNQMMTNQYIFGMKTTMKWHLTGIAQARPISMWTTLRTKTRLTFITKSKKPVFSKLIYVKYIYMASRKCMLLSNT